MTYQDAVSDLVRLWDLLPILVGSPWRELEPSLLDALDYLTAAETDGDRDQRAARVLRLCLPHEPLRRALEPAVRRDDNRSGHAGAVSWAKTSSEITAAIERSGSPGGGQWLIADFEDQVAGEPLRAGRGYHLTIGVADRDQAAGALAAEPVSPLAHASPDAESVTLTIEVHGDADIEVIDPALALPRRGASPDRARFRVTPRGGAGWLMLTAVVLRDRMLVQVLTLKARLRAENTGGPDGGQQARAAVAVRAAASGRPRAEAFASDGPDVTLWMTGDGIGLRGPGPYAIKATLPFGPEELKEISDGPRAALQEIAHGVLDGIAAHQASVAIEPEIYEKCLAALVRAGTLMFRSLFSGPGATQELTGLGRALQDLMTHDGPLWLEVVADPSVVPWHLLAFGVPAGPVPILGLRHRITYLPMRQSAPRRPPSRSLRASDGPLRVVLAVNRDIDEHDGRRRDLVAGQLAAWRQRADEAGGTLAVTVPPDLEISDVLVSSRPPAELLYFFCHAHPDRDPGRLGPIAACLEFTGGHKVSLEDLILGWPDDYQFDAAPLVVLNACSSGVPAPSVYGSFLPYLLGHGARGVIGTEADVPPVFAAAWAREFFARVLDGVPLADAAFELARDLAERHRNLLGLVYALHCDGRSLVHPAIPRGPVVAAAGT
jgi:CHAT domain